MKQNENNRKKFEIDFDAVKQLVDLVKSSKIGRIKVSCDGFDVEVESAKQQVAVGLNGAMAGLPVGVAEKAEVEGNGSAEQESGNLVSSPIVGTFYAAPAPGKPDFVQVGDSVKQGDVLYIVESMKLMNEVKSEFDGVVKKIFVKSGDPVEFGQPIMLID